MISSANFSSAFLTSALISLLVLAGFANAQEKKPYRIDWTKGSISQVACFNGAYFTIRKVRGQEKYVVQELVNISAKSIDEAAGKACSKG
jgi:uncharacterized protein YutD